MPVRHLLVVLAMMPLMATAEELEAGLLEFIAGLEQVDGRWIDPMQLPPLESSAAADTAASNEESTNDDP